MDSVMKLVGIISRDLHNFSQAYFFSFCTLLKILVSIILIISKIKKTLTVSYGTNLSHPAIIITMFCFL